MLGKVVEDSFSLDEQLKRMVIRRIKKDRFRMDDFRLFVIKVIEKWELLFMNKTTQNKNINVIFIPSQRIQNSTRQ